MAKLIVDDIEIDIENVKTYIMPEDCVIGVTVPPSFTQDHAERTLKAVTDFFSGHRVFIVSDGVKIEAYKEDNS